MRHIFGNDIFYLLFKATGNYKCLAALTSNDPGTKMARGNIGDFLVYAVVLEKPQFREVEEWGGLISFATS